MVGRTDIIIAAFRGIVDNLAKVTRADELDDLGAPKKLRKVIR